MWMSHKLRRCVRINVVKDTRPIWRRWSRDYCDKLAIKWTVRELVEWLTGTHVGPKCVYMWRKEKEKEREREQCNGHDGAQGVALFYHTDLCFVLQPPPNSLLHINFAVSRMLVCLSMNRAYLSVSLVFSSPLTLFFCFDCIRISSCKYVLLLKAQTTINFAFSPYLTYLVSFHSFVLVISSRSYLSLHLSVFLLLTALFCQS